MGRPIWQPPENVDYTDELGNNLSLPWYDWFEDQLSKGASTRSMAKILKISHVTLAKVIHRDIRLQDLMSTAQKNWPLMLKQRALELAMSDNPPPSILIFLLKSMAGLTDDIEKKQKVDAMQKDEQEPLVPAITQDEARKMVEQIIKKRDAENVSKKA